jgi:NitT/TauT family transport system ATP-binding protein
VARAFATAPQILLMDEPFASVDEQTRALLQEELLRVWESDRKTVVYITHSIDEALVLGDRVLVMSARPGHVKAEIAVALPRPRSVYELKSTPEFAELVARVWEPLRQEVLGSFGAMGRVS